MNCLWNCPLVFVQGTCPYCHSNAAVSDRGLSWRSPLQTFFWLLDWLIDWLTDWLMDQTVDWLIEILMDWLHHIIIPVQHMQATQGQKDRESSFIWSTLQLNDVSIQWMLPSKHGGTGGGCQLAWSEKLLRKCIAKHFISLLHYCEVVYGLFNPLVNLFGNAWRSFFVLITYSRFPLFPMGGTRTLYYVHRVQATRTNVQLKHTYSPRMANMKLWTWNTLLKSPTTFPNSRDKLAKYWLSESFCMETHKCQICFIYVAIESIIYIGITDILYLIMCDKLTEDLAGHSNLTVTHLWHEQHAWISVKHRLKTCSDTKVTW